MKNFIIGLAVLVSAAIGVKAYAIFPADSFSQKLLTRANNSSPLEGVGDIINHTKNMMRLTYDFAVLGGTATSIGLLDDQGNAAILPKGAIVTNVVMNTLTQPLPATSSINLTLLAGADLMVAKIPPAVGFAAGVPVGTSATWVGPVTAAGGTQPLMVLSGSNFTAGKIEWFVEYVIQ